MCKIDSSMKKQTMIEVNNSVQALQFVYIFFELANFVAANVVSSSASLFNYKTF